MPAPFPVTALVALWHDTPLGPLLLAARLPDAASPAPHTALVGAWFAGQRHFGGPWKERITGAALSGSSPANAAFALLEQARAWLDDYFRALAPALTVPLAPCGTAFQRQVWDCLRHIPYGATTTYGAIAGRLAASRQAGPDSRAAHGGSLRQPLPSGRGLAARAVGQAVGRNPLAIFIPCHRVVGHDGALVGYAPGAAKKAWLAQLERSGQAPSFCA